MLSTRVVVTFIAFGLMMFADEQKRFEIFIWLTAPKFSIPISKDAYEFLIDVKKYCIILVCLSTMVFLTLLTS